MQSIWGSMLMNAASNPIASCKLAAATAAAVAACDGIDGVKDGVIEDPKRCTYDPKALIGTSAGECGAFTEADADIIRKLWQGPTREDGSVLWYGQSRGADLNALCGEPRHAAQAAGVPVLRRLAAVLPHAESAVRLDDDHARRVSSVLGSVRRAVRHRHRHRQSGPDARSAIAAARRSSGTAGPISSSRPTARSTTTSACSSRWAARRRRRTSRVSSRAGRGALRRRSRAAAHRRARRAGDVGRGRQGAGDADRRAPRSDRRGHTLAAAVPVPARREVQGLRQHGRRRELRLQRRVLAAGVHGVAGFARPVRSVPPLL